MKNFDQDIRWQQRFYNFKKAFGQLERFLQNENLNEMEAQGLIKAFEYTYELAWKTLQDLLRSKGYTDIAGPRPSIEQGFQDGYIEDGTKWMLMHKNRNLTSHTYDQETALVVIAEIRHEYFNLFEHLKQKLESIS
jgi:nucleotidyltransferase substrate binding protein (TIGR01987 family)